jgi:bifunctional non-homologous end joining protein LigD
MGGGDREDSSQIKVEGRTIPLSNPDKVLYPKAQFTKRQVIDYYFRAGPVLLPHLKDRALTLKRYPDGVEGGFFYEKRCPSFRPPWVKTAAIWSDRLEATIPFCLANDLATLVWAANLADLELHTALARHRTPDRPTAVVFDLDPGPGADVLDCGEVAAWLRELLAGERLECHPKTSGSKGLQVYVPLNTPTTFDQTKAFARRVAEVLTEQHPDRVLARMERRLRRRKVFIDWSQNDHHKTTICVYSLRAQERPVVSTPVRWEELERAVSSGNPGLLRFETEGVLRRVHELGDLFRPVLEQKQKLPRSSRG